MRLKRLKAAWRFLWNMQIISRDLRMENLEWYVVGSYIYHRCCRCGLTHLVQLAVVEVDGRPLPSVAWQWEKEEVDHPAPRVQE